MYKKIVIAFIFIIISFQIIGNDNKLYQKALNLFYTKNYKESKQLLSNINDHPYKNYLMHSIDIHAPKLNIKSEPLNAINPSLDLYKQFFIYNYYLQKKQYEQSKPLFENIYSKPKSSYIVQKTMLQKAKYLVKTENFNEASNLLKKIRIYPVIDEIEAEIQKLNIEISIQQRRQKKSIIQYGKFIQKFKYYDQNEKILIRINNTFRNHIALYDCLTTIDDRLNYLYTLFELNYLKDAKEEAHKIIKTYPTHKKIYKAYFLLGMINFIQFRFDDAIDNYEHTLTSRPPKNLRTIIQYYKAKSYKNMFQFQLAEPIYKQILSSTTKDTTILSRCYYDLVGIYEKKGPTKEYNNITKKFKSKVKKHRYINQLNWEKKWIQSEEAPKVNLSKNIIQSITSPELFKQLEKRYNNLYPNSNFQKTSKRLPLQYDINKQLSDGLKPKSLKIPNLYKELGNLGLAKIAIEKINHQLHIKHKKSQNLIYAKASLYNQQEKYHKTQELLKPIIESSLLNEKTIPSEFIYLLYPIVYKELIMKYAEKFELDPCLLLAIIKETSKFNPNFETINQTYGLFGINEDIAFESINHLGEYWKQKESLINVEKNIRYASYYISKLFEKYQNNLYIILLSLHKGTAVANNFTAKEKFQTYHSTMTNIPYPDSRSYITNVLNNLLSYKILYNDQLNPVNSP
ncbi:hypothetical protein DID75_02840 [Candidatus Marinamargulisbacteria bacterium SCGC AG-410-N11]|nr:hypothetical protein DID75_02840 [Candidatus Marinamargulisbacteria bacterium SCGC AG-410-N11]